MWSCNPNCPSIFLVIQLIPLARNNRLLDRINLHRYKSPYSFIFSIHSFIVNSLVAGSNSGDTMPVCKCVVPLYLDFINHSYWKNKYTHSICNIFLRISYGTVFAFLACSHFAKNSAFAYNSALRLDILIASIFLSTRTTKLRILPSFFKPHRRVPFLIKTVESQGGFNDQIMY